MKRPLFPGSAVTATLHGLLRPQLLSFRLGFADSGLAGAVGSDSPLILAHLAFCAIAIFRREAALNFLRFLVGAPGVAVGSAAKRGEKGPGAKRAKRAEKGTDAFLAPEGSARGCCQRGGGGGGS